MKLNLIKKNKNKLRNQYEGPGSHLYFSFHHHYFFSSNETIRSERQSPV